MKGLFILGVVVGFFVSIYSEEVHLLGPQNQLSIEDFENIVFYGHNVGVNDNTLKRLDETRSFVDYLLANNIKVYGLTTGFADLRNRSVSPSQAAELSANIIQSHDAGIGAPLSPDIVLGAMVLRANSLSKGYSAFTKEGMNTLIGMINSRIIPVVPSTGSLGASGDLALLARLGRAMQGDCVAVHYNGNILSAKEALEIAGIPIFNPKAKEGLALTNGTSFMASMILIALLKEIHELENIIAEQYLFLNSICAIDAAFNDSIQNVRQQHGQSIIAAILRKGFENSPFINFTGVQNDYCIRCLPQILGPKLEVLMAKMPIACREINAVTDNPLIFRDKEISNGVDANRCFDFNNQRWTVLSGGNFHGEYLADIADTLAFANAKIAITLERQLTYLLNPGRNKNLLPIYLISDRDNIGLLSGYMIPQYTANALTQQICHKALPDSIFNFTSGNEAEDVVSYGSTAAQKLLSQLDLIHQLNSIYLTTAAQAYAIMRQELIKKGVNIPENILCERLFKLVQEHSQDQFPSYKDHSFEQRFAEMGNLLTTDRLRETINFPIQNSIN